ncbi:MAG TPA: hypothetical protein VKB08_05705 [Bradyrhizobium sp.]|jgi:uncharacterized protein YjiS (DUF1127 family)|nr:hypothetical protein [Bradyrhizobium sp.]
MSALFSNGSLLKRIQRGRPARDHQSGSWLKLLDKWLARGERIHQRAALRDLADDPHLLADLGLTREEAIKQGTTSFWH